ncbi:MAG TPA: 6-pyruvoyl-tetrahydropterin synthase-related protein, partial [Pyrinomonadaceae bacterium]|nr:6-pyruvoyl-tetrahydropterin synthase-related protein [Pyrinomonadaceae bacterium]
MESASIHNKDLGNFVLIAAFAVIAMLPSYFGGIPIGNDQSQHYQFAWTVYDSVRSGDVYPSLAKETNRQFGDYGLRFYPPLTYYSLSLVYFIVQDWYFASLIAFTLVFFIGGLGIYLWARDELGPTPALIAALIYILAPYHLNQIYNNFLLAEFFAAAIIPFCFLYLTRLCRAGGWINALGLTIAYAALILTHLPTTILCSLTMGLYTLFLLRRSAVMTTATKLAASVMSALLMTSFYWSRWLPELQWIKHSTSKYFAATWDYSSNFLLRPSHFINFATDESNLWFADALLLVTLVIALPTAAYLL